MPSTPGVNPIKNFFFVTDVRNKLECLSLDTHKTLFLFVMHRDTILANVRLAKNKHTNDWTNK
jgi:hypothetical protein